MGLNPTDPYSDQPNDTDVSLSKRCQISSGWTAKRMIHALDGQTVVSHTSAVAGLGGAYRDRTDDLLNANQALSQLS